MRIARLSVMLLALMGMLGVVGIVTGCSSGPLMNGFLTPQDEMSEGQSSEVTLRSTPSNLYAPQLTVLAEGYVRPIEGRSFVPGETDDGARRVATTVLLIQSGSAVIVADPGMVSDRDVITRGLSEKNLSVNDVTHVFISHHHPDHTVNVGMFPNAKVIDANGIYSGDLWEDHGDNYIIASGVRVMRTPGHTADDATLIIRTPNWTYAYTHLWWSYENQDDPIATSPEELEFHRQRVLQIADWIIPAHGSAYPNPTRATE